MLCHYISWLNHKYDKLLNLCALIYISLRLCFIKTQVFPHSRIVWNRQRACFLACFKIKRYPIGIASVSTYWFMYRKRKHCDALVRPGKGDNDPPQHTFPALTVWDRSFSLFLRWPRDTVSFIFCLSSPNWSFKLWFMAWNRNKNILQNNHAFNFWICPAEAWYYKYVLTLLGLLFKKRLG